MEHVRFPLRIDGRGRTATGPYEQHVEDLLQQLLFIGKIEVHAESLFAGVVVDRWAPIEGRRSMFAEGRSSLDRAVEHALASDGVLRGGVFDHSPLVPISPESPICRGCQRSRRSRR